MIELTLTDIANLVFIALGILYTVVYIIGRKRINQDQTVTDPVCNTEINKEEADHCTHHQSRIYYFHSQECKQKFEENPEKYLE